MLKSLLHSIASSPRIYDIIQAAVGAKYIHGRLAARAEELRGARIVLDLGGGTGLLRKAFGPTSRYICLDLDIAKLGGFREKAIDGAPLLADATRVPLADGSVDVVVCNSVSHHLTDQQLDDLLAESRRILTPGGCLIFMDAVWPAACSLIKHTPRGWIGRALWWGDRGSHPRPEPILRAAIARHFSAIRWERFAVLHRYVLAVASKA